MNRNFELHIEKLVLHGFSPGDRHRIGGAVERELARLFAGQSTPASLVRATEIERLDGGTFQAAPDSKAEAIGVRVARAVFGGLSR